MSNSLPLRLHGRSSSHFTRVVRMIADELALDLPMEVVHDLTGRDPAAYGGHPGLKLPTLQVGDDLLFGTDNICRRLAEIAGRADDERVVLTHHVTSDLVRSAQELVWHAMSAQVQLVIGVNIARLPAENVLTGPRRSVALWSQRRHPLCNGPRRLSSSCHARPPVPPHHQVRRHPGAGRRRVVRGRLSPASNPL